MEMSSQKSADRQYKPTPLACFFHKLPTLVKVAIAGRSCSEWWLACQSPTPPVPASSPLAWWALSSPTLQWSEPSHPGFWLRLVGRCATVFICCSISASPPPIPLAFFFWSTVTNESADWNKQDIWLPVVSSKSAVKQWLTSQTIHSSSRRTSHSEKYNLIAAFSKTPRSFPGGVMARSENGTFVLLLDQ